MPSFHYEAYGTRGEYASGHIDASSEEGAIEQLWAHGLTPFRMAPGNARPLSWWQREVFAGAGAAEAQLAAFTRELATLRAAEIPVDDALRVLVEQATSPRAKAIATGLLADILDGSPLSDAMANQVSIFSPEYVSAVRAGEISGTSHQVLEELADLVERRVELRGRIQSALIYPCVLMLMAMASMTIILTVLVPTIAPIFAENGRAPPIAIRVALAIQSHWLEAIVLMLAVTFGLVTAWRRLLRWPHIRIAVDRLKLWIPKLGPVLLQQETARLARTLGTLLRAGVPLVQALTSARSAISNKHLALGVDRAIDAVRNGKAVHQAFRTETSLSPVALRIMSVGEEAGNLDAVLLRIAVMFEQQTQRSIERFMSLLTPLLTAALALPVAGLILVVMNALLGVNDLVSP
jgi:general secretion pathway protein F